MESPKNIGPQANISRKTAGDITHSCRIKTYRDGSQEIMACSAHVFREPGWELSDKWDTSPERMREVCERRRTPAEQAANADRSMRRAAAQLRDLALSNGFQYFVTLTLDPAKIDRYDIRAVTKAVNTWCDNRVRRRGLAYILVPELHKDGAIHLHGFFNDALEVVDSCTVRMPGRKAPVRPRSAAKREEALRNGAQIVYNLPDWKLGWSTALELRGDYHAAVWYVCKYVRKGCEKIGGRWFLRGGKLDKPIVSYSEASFEDVASVGGCYTFSVANRSFAILRTGEPGTEGGKGNA